MINAGGLNKRITIQAKTGAKDSFGQTISSYADVATVWAEINTGQGRSTGGREFYAAQKLHAETEALFKIRYRTRINQAMRIKYGNRYFEIIHIADPKEKHEELLISAKEVI
jgi:SPP1 family predicted phage head-tail adaptor